MKVTRKRVVLVEMDNVDYMMLLDTLGEASKVRSKLFPSLNDKAASLYGSITAADMGAPPMALGPAGEAYRDSALAEKGADDGTSNE